MVSAFKNVWFSPVVLKMWPRHPCQEVPETLLGSMSLKLFSQRYQDKICLFHFHSFMTYSEIFQMTDQMQKQI